MTAATLAPFWMYSKNGLPDVTDAITDRALAPSRPALTTDPVMASLFQGLNDGRNVRFRLGLGIGDMPRLQYQAGTVLAYHRLFRRHVHGMAAATQQSGSRIGSTCQDYPQKAFPPLQAGFSFAFFVGIFHALLPRLKGGLLLLVT